MIFKSLAENKRLKKELKSMTEQFHAQRQRADKAEEMVLEIATRLKAVNTERVHALQDISKLKAELR